MNKPIPILLLLAFSWSQAHATTIGMHQLRIVNKNAKYTIVSVPFIKAATVRGTLDDINKDAFVVTDNEGAFGQLEGGRYYYLLIRSGQYTGMPILIEKNSDYAATPNEVVISKNGSTWRSRFNSLEGNEEISIHSLYRFNEIFDPDSLIAGSSASNSTRIYRSRSSNHTKREMYWLSDSTHTNKSGWVIEGKLDVGNWIMFPGEAYLVEHPIRYRTEDIDTRVQGEVLDIPCMKMVYKGNSYKSVECNLSRGGSPASPVKLRDLLKGAEGFQGGATPGESDKVTFWNNDEDVNNFIEAWLHIDDQGNEQWLTVSSHENVGDVLINPGSGLMFNCEQSFFWTDGGND